jgi:hypothetical protein
MNCAGCSENQAEVSVDAVPHHREAVRAVLDDLDFELVYTGGPVQVCSDCLLLLPLKVAC